MRKTTLVLFLILITSLILSGCTNENKQNTSNSTRAKKPTMQIGSEAVNCNHPKNSTQRELCKEIEQQEKEGAVWDDVTGSR